ncbi:flagellar basal body-associated FliL family protein [Gammaproteobacteria bacterium AS21]
MLSRSVLFLLFSLFTFNALAAEEVDSAEEYIAYVELKPFTANFGESTELHFVKCEITIQAGSSATEIALGEHLPSIRNDLLFLLMAQNVDTMNTVAAQKNLAKSALLVVKQRLIDEVGEEAADVTDLFFVSFVAQ